MVALDAWVALWGHESLKEVRALALGAGAMDTRVILRSGAKSEEGHRRSLERVPAARKPRGGSNHEAGASNP